MHPGSTKGLPGMTRLRVAILLFALLALPQFAIHAQTTEPQTATTTQLQYDVASIKPHGSADNGMQIGNTPDGFRCLNLDLRTLISNAFDIRRDLISGGPGWVDSARFDVDAKVAGQDLEAYKKLTYPQRRALLQAMLADRFHLKLHHETRTLPLYNLVIAKSGFLLKPLPPFTPPPDVAKDSEAAKRPGIMTMGPGMFQATGVGLAALADNLAEILEHTVVDKTGLTGEYDFKLKWHPEDSGPPAEGDPGISLFTAVQEQLGLKLESAKGPVDILVIDHAEQPAAN
jgi:uncharacterized protein (TIGR03435 family)